ncbi:FliG C-terminal domain-containing protein [Paracoccus sp. 1_MG-2023]|uniref:FliG C-terminal domain-containing protein n=1 Tax=unclassified Paracoccus (in: a-proteobacteria) TaxID=2688777 RepID=UPI001C09C390|nr:MULTISPECIES: FliG C-terminal domain-containing protein [unclassified Paracoccus (in: a-proteobacteria)]MBU2959054.1 flagellar motor switch protein FliG [Paracoccus sp. C2R09]MDO6669027.1 FliG C-terminal domain-containing protein [Paracoccus sp. 1_MG-2023]
MQMGLTQRQKAAVIVRLLLDDDQAAGLDRLNTDAQTLLAEEMAGMEVIDRPTRDAVIQEFCDRLEAVGLTFPGDLDGTLAIFGERISADSSDRLRRNAAISGRGDPWARIATLPAEQLCRIASGESVELIALMLSKLPVPRASEVFASLSRDRAHSVAQAMALTGEVTPDALRRVGLVLLRAVEDLPRPAIPTPAADRMGAILNFATSDLRDDVLDGLDQRDADFAEGVRKAIFIFGHVPERLEPRDVARLTREVDQAALLRAMASTAPDDAAAADFILSNLSQRMADNLREERDALPKLRPKDIEDAKLEVVAAIRRLEERAEITLKLPEADA